MESKQDSTGGPSGLMRAGNGRSLDPGHSPRRFPPNLHPYFSQTEPSSKCSVLRCDPNWTIVLRCDPNWTIEWHDFRDASLVGGKGGERVVSIEAKCISCRMTAAKST